MGKPIREVRNPDFPFHGSGRFPRHPFEGVATGPGGGVIGPRVGGAMIRRFTEGLIAGPQGFLPVRMSPFSQLILFSGSTRGRIGFARNINLRCSSYFLLAPEPHDLGMGGIPMF